MEWSWKMIKNGMVDVTPFLLFESYGDSDDVITHVHHHHQEEHEQEQEQEDMHDDAMSCSYDDHASHVNAVKSHDHTKHHQGHVYDDDHKHGHDHVHGYDDDDKEDIDDDDDDDDDKNWGESKMMGQEKRCHGVFIDSSNLDDRQFWETCLGS